MTKLSPNGIADFFIPNGADDSDGDDLKVAAYEILTCIAQQLIDENRLTNASLNKVIFDTTRADLCAWFKHNESRILAKTLLGAGVSFGDDVLATLAQAVNATRYKCAGACQHQTA